MPTLNVGAGQAYATLADAVADSQDGDIIAVQAGTYVNDFATISTDISIVGVGGMANFVATESPPNGKAILVTQSDVTIENLGFSGSAVPDGNGAGIRYEGGNLVVEKSYFHGNQNGILAAPDPNGTIRIAGSEFADNGSGDGYTHNLYVNDIASLTIDDSYFHDANIGHQIKSRAQSTTITNSRIYDGSGTGSYSIDLPNGGVGVIRDNVIQQGQNGDNPVIIHYGGESEAYDGSSLVIEDNVVVNDLGGGRLLSNDTTVTATVSDNEVYGLGADEVIGGLATLLDTVYLSARPALDSSAPWLDGGGSDTIFGTDGPDTLMGTDAADTMAGLAGNDTYIVANAGDIVTESPGEGTDIVRSSISYTLPTDIENLTLTGTETTNANGNTLSNVLTGNSGDNILKGMASPDTMRGGAGNDLYYVGDYDDVVEEDANEGEDRIKSSVSYNLAGQHIETLILTADRNVDATGNSLDNTLVGNPGDNVLNGNAGADVLTGGDGSDVFAFTSSLVAGEVDTITDFGAGDTIRLSSTVFNTIEGTGTLGADQFVANASGTAENADSRIIYETDTGKLFFDSNGSAAGGATQFAAVAPGLDLTRADFTVA